MNKNNRGFVWIGLAILVVAALGLYAYKNINSSAAPREEGSQKGVSPQSAPDSETPSQTTGEAPRSPSQPSASLGQTFRLGNGQTMSIAGTGLEVTVTGFINSPCPPGANCVWSGRGVSLEYRLGGRVEKGVNLAQAFGYATRIVGSDYQTYAELVVNKAE